MNCKCDNSLYRTENTILEGDAWGEDEGDYYNDRPGARPPSPEQKSAFHLASQYASPKSNLPVSYLLSSRYISTHSFIEFM